MLVNAFVEGSLLKHMQAIGWTIADTRGINPSFCMDSINLEEEAQNLVENQRRLNFTMKEVVRKEILKWLDVDVIYLIADSTWVSPV